MRFTAYSVTGLSYGELSAVIGSFAVSFVFLYGRFLPFTQAGLESVVLPP